jgi:hypothetical protein
MPDPDIGVSLYESAYRAYYYSGSNRELPHELVVALFTLAQGYLDLTTYELGQEHCVAKLRDIWRARKAKGS